MRRISRLHTAAAAGDVDTVRRELRRGAPIDSRDQRGFTALACAAESSLADEAMLRLLIDAGADVNLAVEDGKHCPLELAVCGGQLEKVRCLLDAGANASFVDPNLYTVVTRAVYALHAQPSLMPMIELLARHGADLDQESTCEESPLNVMSRFGQFDVVQCLLDCGADPSPLNWTPLLRTAALGTCAELAARLDEGASTSDTDYLSRTALHLAVLSGDLEKVRLLHAKGCSIDQPDQVGNTPLIAAAMRGKVEVLSWLVERGANLEHANFLDATALEMASATGQADCVRVLLQAGANLSRRNRFDQTAMSQAANEPVVRLLLDAGGDPAEISVEVKRQMMGLPTGGPLQVTAAQYQAGRERRFGQSNPEVMKIPFWHEMVRTGVTAYEPRIQFGDMQGDRWTPVWCFSRFGMSFTELPDGRVVQIGGEHEDYYDPDFCIYNEVVVHDRSGQFQIMGYPEDVFPPTDFHSATFVNDSIYIVGRLGYSGARQFGTTPVYQLNCRTWKLKPIATTGENPGWIHNHRTKYDGTGSLVVSGGKICQLVDGRETTVENTERFELDLERKAWRRL